MSHQGFGPSGTLGFRWFAKKCDGGSPSGRVTRRRRRSDTIGLCIEYLENRKLLAVSAVIGPLPTAPTATVETLNVQLQSGAAGSLSTIMPLITAAGASVQPTTLAGVYEVAGPTANMSQLAIELSASSAVLYAERQLTVSDQQAPNDPYYVNGTEWQLNGTWGINAPGAWSVTVGSNSVIVADTDTGIAYNVPDLYDNVWINQAEIPSSVKPNLTDVNGDGLITFADLNNAVNQGPGKIVDSNGDGIITAADLLAPTSAGGWASGSTQDGSTANPDDLIGWNFDAGNNNPLDSNGHGTFTAGEIGAVTNNGVGVAGTNWNVQLMPVQFLDSSGSGSDTAAASAIDYAVDHGAKVINASWGGSGTDATIFTAIQYANAHNVIIVAAAGNSGTDDDTSFFAPASYAAPQYLVPNLISVAAIGSDGTLASFSNYGVASVELAAPGLNLVGVGLNGTYTYDSGTSMAAPMVAGTIALVESAHPTWSMSQVIDAVLDNTTPDSALVGKVTTGGVVNAAAAVANTDGPYVVSATPDGSVNSTSGLSSVTLNFNEEINPSTFSASQVTVTGPSGTISGVSVAAVAGSNYHQFTVTFPTQLAAGTFTVKLAPTLKDWYGNNLNQNRNGVNGESADAFVATIRQTAPGSSDLLSVTGIPTAVTAGTSQTFTVTALSPGGGTDTGYLGTIKFTSTDPLAVLPTPTTLTAGTRSFAVTFKTAGAQSITATDTANGAIIGTQENFIVQGAVASSLKISGLPATAAPGAAQSLTVTALDAYGNVATGYTGTVHFTSSDGQATLPANYTPSPQQQGTFVVSATFQTLGTQSITATDSANSAITATASLTVSLSSPATAMFLDKDTTTQGTWIGKYGSQGYDLANSGISLPANVTVTTTGASSYTWTPAASTTAVQSLQVPPSGATRIAATWFASTSFTVNVNAGSGTRDLELYFLDYDQLNRGDQIQISDAGTGVVLSTQSVSGFAAGVYMNYAISGNVLITLTRTSGANVVLSGLFFDPAGATVSTVTGVGSSVSPSTYGQSVTFTATVADTGGVVPTGTVEFYDGSTDLGHGSALSGGGNSATSTFTTSTLAAGTHSSITAIYTPSGSFAGSTGSMSQTVNAAALTITANSTSKIYGNLLTFAGTEFTTSGLLNGNTVSSVTLTSGGAAASAAVAGSPYAIVASAASGSGLSNYTITYVSGQLTVSRQALTIQASTNTKVYDGTTSAAAIPSVSGLKGSDTVTNLTETYATSAVGTGKTLTVSTYTVNDGNGGNNYTVSLVANNTGVITAAASSATAVFLTKDTTTQGTWIGKYGSQGYDLANSGISLPANVTVTTTGASSYTWTPAASTTAVQSLQVPPSGATRIAATWFASTSFTVNVNAGSGTRDLELYFLDYDQLNRGDQIQISDAGTGVVLSTQSVSGFAAGVYMNYAISGNVLITLTKTSGANVVLSGLFFDSVTSNGVIIPPTAPVGSLMAASVTAGAAEIGTLDVVGTDSQAATPSVASTDMTPLVVGGKARARVVQGTPDKPAGWFTGFGTA